MVKTVLAILNLTHLPYLHISVKRRIETYAIDALDAQAHSAIMTKKPITVEVSQRALLGRIDRALRKKGQRVRTDRRGRGLKYILIDTEKRAIVETDLNLEKLGRKLDVLEPWERAALNE